MRDVFRGWYVVRKGEYCNILVKKSAPIRLEFQLRFQKSNDSYLFVVGGDLQCFQTQTGSSEASIGFPLHHSWRILLGQRSWGTRGRGKGGRNENSKQRKDGDPELSHFFKSSPKWEKLYKVKYSVARSDMMGHSVDNWKLSEYWWDDPFIVFSSFCPYYHHIVHSVACFLFSLQQELLLLCGLSRARKRDSMRGSKKWSKRRRQKERGFGVVQQLDIDQSCRMVTRQPIVSSVCSVLSVPPFSVFSLLLCVNSPHQETFFSMS